MRALGASFDILYLGANGTHAHEFIVDSPLKQARTKLKTPNV